MALCIGETALLSNRKKTPVEPESSTPEQSSKEEKNSSPAPAIPESNTASSTAKTRTRPTRATKLPGQFKDFVLDK